jgi:UDP-N-acetylglucosamine:LPS N-acetylglucosamine transferase
MKADFLFFDAGGGHRSAALALRLAIQRQRRQWDVRLVNLQELLDPLDVFRKLTGLRLQDIYNLMLKRGWTLGSGRLVGLMHAVIRLYHRKQVALLEKHWRVSQPDLVVSLVPNFNRAIAASVARALPGVPFVTVLTDLADYPPHFWIERESQYLICGSDRAVEQAMAMGHTEEKIYRTSGMILHPRFYDTVELDRGAERERLGLDPKLTTALVLFGGQGSKAMLEIAERLDDSPLDLQLILICGRNQKLQSKLMKRPHRLRWFIEGFTTEVPHYMRLSDFFIGKPGPGSISEALAMKLPVIVENNSWTLPQERYNAEWVVGQGVGVAVSDFRHIAEVVRQVIEPANLASFRARAAALDNQAVFEIPGILAAIQREHAERQTKEA